MKLQKRLTPNAHWLLRTSMVSVFLSHGILKFMNLQGFADMLLPLQITSLTRPFKTGVEAVLPINLYPAHAGRAPEPRTRMII